MNDATKYLNLGCGSRFHPAWTNIDFIPAPGVIVHDLSKGIPFSDDSFDMIYHSHVLEHFSKEFAQDFLKDCYRVLKPGGILRVVVPDLEQIARNYLLALEQAAAGSEEWKQNYEWVMLELFDQTTRNSSGGNIKSYLAKPDLPNWHFIVKRIGAEAEQLRPVNTDAKAQPGKVKKVLDKAARVVKRPALLKAKLIDYRQLALKKLLGKNYELWQLGKFRKSGEIHQWMYDRFSLKQLLENQGFSAVTLQTATESYIEGWPGFNLDTDSAGKVFKPDSLFMEAKKPTE